MGNIDSRACVSFYPGGYLYVKTDKPFYHPGERVLGKVYIRAQGPIDASWLEFKVDGKEKVSFRYRFQEQRGDVMFEEVRKTKKERKILNFRGVGFRFQQHLNAGDFTVPFAFTLPGRLPASILYHDKTTFEMPKAKIRYSIQAVLHTHSGRQLKYKQLLMIHEPPVPFVQGNEQRQVKELKSCFCMGKGTGVLQARFDKNVFYNNEWAGADVLIENKDSQVDIVETEFQVCQRMHLNTMFRSMTHNKDVLENQDRDPIPAGHPTQVVKKMGLDLSSIRYVVNRNQMRTTKNVGMVVGWMAVKVAVPRSPEEIFQLENLAPATHSDIVTNDYFLNVNTKFGGLCIPGNSLSVPLTIIPTTHLGSYGFVEPEGYQPFQLGFFEFDLSIMLYNVPTVSLQMGLPGISIAAPAMVVAAPQIVVAVPGMVVAAPGISMSMGGPAVVVQENIVVGGGGFVQEQIVVGGGGFVQEEIIVGGDGFVQEEIIVAQPGIQMDIAF